MSAPSTNDDLFVLMGHMPPEEFERRNKLRQYRNAATAMLTSTRCETSRHLAWEVIEWASPNLYAAAPLEWLDKLNLLSSRLLKTAMTAEELQAMLEMSDG